MKTVTILDMEDITGRVQIANPDALIPVSASLTLRQKPGENTFIELVTELRNVCGEDLPEGGALRRRWQQWRAAWLFC